MNKNILECSSRGDRRFSAFYAYTTFDNNTNSIENIYQRCKYGFGGKRLKKGDRVSFIKLRGRVMDVKYLTPFYELLWCKYLDEHPDLVAYARTFDDYNDMFKGKSINCQADVIRKYIREGREVILRDAKEFIELLTDGK